jgi:hypothetical protein
MPAGRRGVCAWPWKPVLFRAHHGAVNGAYTQRSTATGALGGFAGTRRRAQGKTNLVCKIRISTEVEINGTVKWDV